MSVITFFPRLDEDMADGAGISAGLFYLSYRADGEQHILRQKGKRSVTLEDPSEIWRVENNGLNLRRTVTIESPQRLYGANGIACRAAEIGLCLIWTNSSLSQMGYILPNESTNSGTLYYSFNHSFAPGEVAGDLVIDTVLYVKTPALIVGKDEHHLMNEAGVVIGTIDSIKISLSSNEMDFPIVEISDKDAPLWWLELNDWEDPTSDPFNEDYVCLYLNNAHPAYPMAGKGVGNEDLLIEIISTAYLMIFQKIEEYNRLDETFNNIGLEPGSISKVMEYFVRSCEPSLHTETNTALQKSIRANVERMLKAGDDDEA